MAEENFQFERADSIVEPLQSIRNKIRKKYTRYKNNLVGVSICRGVLTARIKGGAQYRTSQVVSPVLEMRTISKALRFTYSLLKSKTPINDIPMFLKRKIREEKKRLKELLGEEREEINEEDKRIYDLMIDMTDGQRYLNGFYEELGERVEKEFLENMEFVEDYQNFVKKYDGVKKRKLEKLGQELFREDMLERAEQEAQVERARVTARQLTSQEKTLLELLRKIKEGERNN